MSKLRLSLVVLAIAGLAYAHLARAGPADDTATCSVQATVGDIMEWDNFTGIDLGTISAQGDVLTGNSTITLFTNDDVSITADTSVTAELDDGGGDTLYTEYGLQYSEDGTTDTGGSDVAYTVYSSFLSGGSAVTHIPGDGAVDVTLQARASNPTGTLADAGTYNATQTLTASWAGT